MHLKNPHFEFPPNWQKARELLDFVPVAPPALRSGEPLSLAVFVRDHKQRELPRAERSLEAHYADFVLTQARPGAAEAQRLALETAYGRAPQKLQIRGRDARAFPAGPDPGPDDPDPRNPAVLAWCDGPMFYLLASETLDTAALAAIAESMD